MKREEEITSVYKLGEEIGYGNLMEIASALWEKDLTTRGEPAEGAFVPTIRSWIKKKYQHSLEVRPHRLKEVSRVLGKVLKHSVSRIVIDGFVRYDCSCGYQTNAAELTNGKDQYQSFREQDALGDVKKHLKDNGVVLIGAGQDGQ